jgi:signal transduction histidine kinase
MSAGTDRAQRFLDDLLDLARSADPALPCERDVALDAALDAALAELEAPLRQGRVVVQRRALPSAPLERYEAERVFVHLLRSAAAAGATDVRIWATEDGDRATVLVSDNGTPPPEGAARLEPFAAPRGRGPLVGAGVSLVVGGRILRRRGGDLALRCEDGRVEVRLTVPRRPPAAA